MRRAVRAVPFTHRQRELNQKMTTCRTHLRRRKEAVKLNVAATVPLGFVCQLPEHLSPCGIADRLRQTMILEHIGHRQSFNKDSLVFADDLCRELVQVILARVCYFGVNLCNCNSRLAAIVAPFYLATQAPLANLQTSLFAVQKLWIRQLLTMAQGRKLFQTNVDPDRRFNFLQRPHVGCNVEADKVSLSRVFRDGERLNFSIPRQPPRPAYFKRHALFCQNQFVAFERKGVLGVASGLLALRALEVRIVGALLKEVPESSLEIAQRLLQHNAADFVQERCIRLLFELRQHGRRRVIVQSPLALLPSRCAGIKHSVVDESDATEGLRELLFLRLGWKASVLVSSLNLHV